MLRCCISPGALQQGRLGCARPIKRAAFFGRILCLQGRARRTTMVRLSTQADQMNFQMLIILDLQFFTPHTNNLKNSGKKKENINKQLLLSLFCPLPIPNFGAGAGLRYGRTSPGRHGVGRLVEATLCLPLGCEDSAR